MSSERVLEARTARSGFTQPAAGTGQLTLTFASVFGNRWELTHLLCQDEGGESVVRTIEVASDVTVIFRHTFLAAVGASTFAVFSGSPILIARGVQILTVRLLASGAVAVVRRLQATAVLRPDTEISSGI